MNCTHTVCRYAESDRLIREMLRGDFRPGVLGEKVTEAHRGAVPCRMAEQKPPPVKSASSDLFSAMGLDTCAPLFLERGNSEK